MTVLKTMKAQVLWQGNKIAVFDYGDKDSFGKTIWYDENGKAYSMIYARRARQYSLNPYPYYDKL